MTMTKGYILPILTIITLLLCSCNNKVPEPAINFSNSIEEMKNAESGKLIEEYIATKEAMPTTLVYKLNHKTFKYVVEADTIIYWFLRDKLFNVLVQTPNIPLEKLKEQMNQTYQVDDEEMGFYKSDNFFVKVGQEKEGSYSVYFNPTDELLLHTESLKRGSTYSSRNETLKQLQTVNGFQFGFKMLLMLSGAASMTGPIDYYSSMVFM